MFGYPAETLPRRAGGNALILGLILVTMISAFIAAQMLVTQKNSRHSSFTNELRRLRHVAESGIQQSVYELGYGVGNGDGKIGTELWTYGSDLGSDGRRETKDEGESDGIPSPGEPNLSPRAVCAAGDGTRLFTYAVDSPWTDVKRVVSTAYNGIAEATVEVYVKTAPLNFPGISTLYVEPEVVLDLGGNAFRISGTDTNPDGTRGPGAKVFGITTRIGSPPGSNASAFKDQVPSKSKDQVTGVGANPSIGETDAVDFEAIFNAFKRAHLTVLAPATYTGASLGDYQSDQYQVSYSPGDLHLSGKGKGAGVLLVDGALTVSGSFTFVGLVLVRGDLRVTGGGNGVHLYGSAMVGETLTAGKPETDVKMTGTADLFYSSKALAKVAGLLPHSVTVMYWNDLK